MRAKLAMGFSPAVAKAKLLLALSGSGEASDESSCSIHTGPNLTSGRVSNEKEIMC